MPLTSWSNRTRLTAPRLVWSDSHYAKHEVRRLERRGLRAWTRLGRPSEGRVEAAREHAQMFAGMLGR